jgi:hypothetical protein
MCLEIARWWITAKHGANMEDDDDAFKGSGTITFDGVSLDDSTWIDISDGNYTYNTDDIVTTWGSTANSMSIYSNSWPTTTGNMTIGSTNLDDDDGTFIMRKGDREEDLFQMADRLRSIEKLLNIPRRDIALEEKYPDLEEEFKEHMGKVIDALVDLPTPEAYNKKCKQYKAWEKLKEKKDGDEE